MKFSRSEQLIIFGVILTHLSFILIAVFENNSAPSDQTTAIQASLIESKSQTQPEAPPPKSPKTKKESKAISIEKSALKTLAPEESKLTSEKSSNTPAPSSQTTSSTSGSNAGIQTPANVELNQLVILYKPDTDVFYPSFSKRIGEEGNVEMRIQIDESGSVQNVQVVKSSNSTRLDKAATELALRIRFKPYIQNGGAIKVVAKFGVKFKLKD